MSFDNEEIEKILNEEKEITYDECKKLWEDESTLVHHDTSEKLIMDVTRHISKMCNLKENDILLNIGCGDGLFDSTIIEMVNDFYGVDFSAQKLSIAKNRVPRANYIQQSFLNDYHEKIKNAGISKIYSYSVVQYCHPQDLERFILKQLELCRDDKEYLIAHLDIPDKKKAVYYYKKRYSNITQEMLDGKIKTLFGDGSYWHNMDDFKTIADKYGLECEIKEANYWDYRSDVIIRFNGKIVNDNIEKEEMK